MMDEDRCGKKFKKKNSLNCGRSTNQKFSFEKDSDCAQNMKQAKRNSCHPKKKHHPWNL